MIERLKRGRPRKDVEDQLVVDVAAFLQVLGLSRQRARDLALAYIEAQEATPTKLPRGAGKALPHSVVTGYELPPKTSKAKISKARKPPSFEGRTRTIREKRLQPRANVVAAFIEIFRALVRKDDAAILEGLERLKQAK